jgi:hypothetical protein
MAADASVALSDIRPIDIFSQVQENTEGALVGAFGEDNLIAFVKPGIGLLEVRLNKSNAGHLHAPF